MGLFDWLRGVFGGGKTPPPSPRAAPRTPPPPADPGRWQQPAFNDGGLAAPAPPAPARPAPPQPPVPEAPQRPAGTLNLDAAQFTPLSDAEAKKQAQGMGSALYDTRFAFGRTSIIPPATDPRTLLIDRAMVAQGLITADELTEIHRVGEQMDEIRPDPHMLSALAQRATTQSQAQREQIKAQKKAEAAERQRKRAEGVARRKATDIIFLGRGISRGLADRRANVERLQSLGLPVLATPADVATALGLSIPRLRWLAFHSDAATRTHYVRFSVPKKSGGMRELCAPHRQLAVAQEWILTSILEKVPTHAAAHGFVPGRSTVSNARLHVGKKLVVNADLKEFFPTVTVRRVIGIFRELGYSPAVATVLALLCTEAPRRVVTYAGTTYHVATGPRALPQGACTSPALSNLVSRSLDARLTGIAGKLGWTYTRYADDLTFSSDMDERIGYLLARLRHIAADEGFAVNEKKTRVQRRHHAMTVTGIVVNDRPGPGRELVRRLRTILHQAKQTGLAAQNREKKPHFEAWVRGMVAYIQMVTPEHGGRLREALRELKA